MMLTEANYRRVANSRHDAADHIARKRVRSAAELDSVDTAGGGLIRAEQKRNS
ncbi:hypothetical protein [Rhodococcus sp. P1Y]|uniref:hypothetical protein n=1 Tax=Rhodococcus sp. P1Y TaxID=1302308 RepID=UPI0012933BA1|nr:hypothetical protein [Rhodococcus sp. P1Y]